MQDDGSYLQITLRKKSVSMPQSLLTGTAYIDVNLLTLAVVNGII